MMGKMKRKIIAIAVLSVFLILFLSPASFAAEKTYSTDRDTEEPYPSHYTIYYNKNLTMDAEQVWELRREGKEALESAIIDMVNIFIYDMDIQGEQNGEMNLNLEAENLVPVENEEGYKLALEVKVNHYNNGLREHEKTLVINVIVTSSPFHYTLQYTEDISLKESERNDAVQNGTLEKEVIDKVGLSAIDYLTERAATAEELTVSADTGALVQAPVSEVYEVPLTAAITHSDPMADPFIHRQTVIVRVMVEPESSTPKKPSSRNPKPAEPIEPIDQEEPEEITMPPKESEAPELPESIPLETTEPSESLNISEETEPAPVPELMQAPLNSIQEASGMGGTQELTANELSEPDEPQVIGIFPGEAISEEAEETPPPGGWLSGDLYIPALASSALLTGVFALALIPDVKVILWYEQKRRARIWR